MRELINDLKNRLVEYTQLVKESESKGLETLNSEETEYYGAYLGKKELLEELVPKLESIYKLMK
jgi:hypothetical protein